LGSHTLITKKYIDPDLIKLVDLHTRLMNATYSINTYAGKANSSLKKYNESKKKLQL